MEEPTSDPTHQLLVEITALIDDHLQRHGAPTVWRRDRNPRVHQAPAPLTVFTGNIGTVITGNTTADGRWASVHRALRNVRTRLPEVELDRTEHQALLARIDEALSETVQVQPRRRRLRRMIGGIIVALTTSIASGATKPIASELVAELQRVPF